MSERERERERERETTGVAETAGPRKTGSANQGMQQEKVLEGVLFVLEGEDNSVAAREATAATAATSSTRANR